MKRQKKFKRMRLPPVVDGAKNFVFQKTTSIVVVFIFLLVSYILITAFLHKSDYFKMKVVETRLPFLDQRTAASINNQLLNTYAGRNIFGIALKEIADSLQASYPDAKEVVVRISLPDKIVVNMKSRRPVALLKNAKLYPIDSDGIVLQGADSLMMKDLPIIEGIDLRYDEKMGKRSVSAKLKLALNFLKEIKRTRLGGEYGTLRIDASDPANISFYLGDGPEIKIGSENFKERLEVLAKTLKEPRLVLEKIKYIDLRFKEVIIGPK